MQDNRFSCGPSVGKETVCIETNRILDSCREDAQVIYLPGLQWYEKLSADLIYYSVRTELAAHIMIERMLCSCEDLAFCSGQLMKIEVEEEIEDVETTQDEGFRLSVVYDKKQTRIDPRPGIR